MPVDNFSIHDLSYNHYIEHHIDPYEHTHAHTIYTKPADMPPRFQFLTLNNYLGEFKTEIDKAKARFNLGIPDEYSLSWGNLAGNIEEQDDLVNFIVSQTEGSQKWKNTIDRKLQDLQSLLSLVINKIGGTEDDPSIKNLTDVINNNSKEINKLWTNVANNSRDLTLLYEVLKIDDTNKNFTALIAKNTLDISALSIRLTSIEDKLPELGYEDVRKDLADLKEAVSELLRELGSNTLLEIVASNTYWEVTPTSDDIPVTITAKYNLAKDKDITSLCNVVSDNRNVATWNTESKAIVINSQVEETSTANITFTYNGKSVTITVKVKTNKELVSVQYIGYANLYTDLDNNNYAVLTVAGTWNQSNLYNGIGSSSSKYRLWIATTENIDKITLGGVFVLEPEEKTTATFSNNTLYNIYRVVTVKDTTAEFNISLK